jgi:LAO/AO transport system kinase
MAARVRTTASSSAVTAEAVRAGNRRALARAITLAESTRTDDRSRAEALLGELLPDTGHAIRLGISGVPGVGKSTFIEAFGLRAIERGHRVAVLAVDPSSKRSGGSILGDKTRMELLARDVRAFIRPSPAGATLGGVARRTREASLLCEAAGFDVVLVETVGVGQSETAVADMVDMFVLLIQPGGGDELQGLKRGIVEIADLLVVTKADGDLAAAAGRAAADYKKALTFLRAENAPWRPEVLQCSALTGKGIDAVWQAIERYRAATGASGALERRRRDQARRWLWNEVSESLLDSLRAHPAVRSKLRAMEEEVAAGRLAPGAAAATLLGIFQGRKGR